MNTYIEMGLIPSCAIATQDAMIFGFPHYALQDLHLPPLPADRKTGSPDLIIEEDEHGDKKVIASLSWGKHLTRVTVNSEPCTSYREAISRVISLANSVQIEEQVNAHAELSKMLTSKRKFDVPVFRNIVTIGVPRFTCSVLHKGTIYISKPHRLRYDALKEIAEIFDGLPAPNSPANAMPKTPRPPAKIANRLDAKKSDGKAELKMFVSLVARWRKEHAWLLSNKCTSTTDQLRVDELSRFLAIADPLRKYELGPVTRAQLIKKIETELTNHAHRLTDDGRRQMLARYIRKMTKANSMCPGDIVNADSNFIDFAHRNGDDPSAIKKSLIEGGFLRCRNANELTLSNRGITLVEQEIQSGYKGTAIGSTVPPAILFALLN